MYLCKNCGNKSRFEENICVSNLICLDEEFGDFVRQYELSYDVVEVVCNKCEQSTEDSCILDRSGNPITINRS